MATPVLFVARKDTQPKTYGLTTKPNVSNHDAMNSQGMDTLQNTAQIL